MFLQAPPTPWQAQMCPLVTSLEVAEQAVSGIGQPLASSLRRHLGRPHLNTKTMDLYQPPSVHLNAFRV